MLAPFAVSFVAEVLSVGMGFSMVSKPLFGLLAFSFANLVWSFFTSPEPLVAAISRLVSAMSFALWPRCFTVR